MPESVSSDLTDDHVKKTVKFYRNGDSASHPSSYVYDASRITSFKHLLDDIQNLPLFDDGYTRITRLYTIDGRRIGELGAFEAADMTDFVATGPEGFMRIKGGYQNHVGYQSPTEHHPQDPSHTLTTEQLQYKEEATQHRPILQRPKSNRPYRPQPLYRDLTYDQSSYRDLNKQRYGELPRLYGDRIENRVDIGTVKRIYLYRNGDPFFKPKLYIYRSKVHKKWDRFLEDLEKLAPPIRGGAAHHLYTLRGKELTSFDQLSDKRGYVVAGADGFLDVKGGYDLIGKVDHRSASAVPEISRPMTQQHRRPKTGFLRGPGESLLDRRLPEPTFFFVFKNGDGLEAKRFLFTPQQMDKGMPWLMEQIGRRFGIYAHKLVTMDNREITDPRQFINRGAYIIIPFGEQFRENWHHFPEMAIDTSVFSHREAGSRSQSRLGRRPRTSNSRSQSRLGRSRSVASRMSLRSARHETLSDEERYAKQLLHHDTHHNGGLRRGSASSHCSFCDLLERHRLTSRAHSADDINDKIIMSKSQVMSPDNPMLEYPRQPHMYSAEDVNNILPPRPVTSRRLRLSPHALHDDNGYPVRSSSLSRIMPLPAIDDHGPVIHSRRGSEADVHDLVRQNSNLDHVHEPVPMRRVPTADYQIEPIRQRSNLSQHALDNVRQPSNVEQPQQQQQQKAQHGSTMDSVTGLTRAHSEGRMVNDNLDGQIVSMEGRKRHIW